jgi:hypothetical protein
MMKDIMQKLAELEATAPKVTKKKMLNEDSTTPPMNISNKPASLKDVFENMAMQKPIPVVGKEGDTQQTGAGFLNINDTSPAGQAMQKALTDLAGQGKAQIVMPTKPGQPQATAAGQSNPNQMQAGQQAMQEESFSGGSKEDLAKEMYLVASKIIGYENRSARVPENFWQQYNNLRATWEKTYGELDSKDIINDAFHLGEYVHWVKDKGAQQKAELGDKLTYQVRQDEGGKWIVFDTQFNKPYSPGKDDKNKVEILAAKLNSTQPKQSAPAAPAQPQQKSFMGRVADKAKQAIGMKEEQINELSTDTMKDYARKRSYTAFSGDRKPGESVDDAIKRNSKQINSLALSKTKINRARDTGSTVLNKENPVPANEGKKVDRMVKHIEKSERKLGKSKGEAEDIAWATANKRGMLDNKNKKKVKEADIPSSAVDLGGGLGAGRSATTLEGKKPDFLDLDKDGNKKEPMKKAAADKKKKKVDESMNHRISAARLEGKSHGLRGHAHSGKRYEDLDEMKAYHEGYKEGLDECYGQGVYETAPAMPAATVGGMADQEMEEGKLGKALTGLALAGTLATAGGLAKDKYDYHYKKDPQTQMTQSDFDTAMGGGSSLHDPAARGAFNEDDMEEGNAFTAALAKTPKGGKFAVGGKTFTDRTGYDAKVNEYAFESWDNQLNDLLNEGAEVNEGLSVSISKGQENSPDSVTITAQDAEAEHLLAFVKNAGLGLFGDDNVDTHSSAMSVQPSHGAPDEVGAGGIDIGVVDGHDGMMGLMQKLSGIQSGGADDYADEEGDEEQLYGNHEEASKKNCGCDGDCECSDYDQPSNEETCNECGGMMEAGHSCGSKEVVDEVESEDQMEFEVAEDNAPDSGEAESTADEDAEAKEDAALAGEKEEEMNEGSGDEPKHRNSDDKDDKDFDDEEKVSESSAFASLFKKLSMISEEATDKEDEKAEKAGKKVTKDIEYDDKKDKKGMSDKQAKFFGKKTDKEKVDEWANNAGPGKTVSDTTFEQDIDFMTKVISGGLNKQKSTGQTTIPVIAGQTDRMGVTKEAVNESVSDWVKLAGIK